MTSATPPPTGQGPLARREARLAWSLLLPTLTAVFLVVALPLVAVFWISFKPVELADLRAPVPIVKESLRGRPKLAGGDEGTWEFKLRNSSPKALIAGGVTFTDVVPEGGLTLGDVPDPPCAITGQTLRCDFGDLAGGQRHTVKIPPVILTADAPPDVKTTAPVTTGKADNVLTNLTFSLENFARIFDSDEFWHVLYVTLFYTIFGTIGALVMGGLFAAMLLNKSFRGGQGILRGLYLFPYVAPPVIAVAFTWVTLFDPFSGSANALLVQMGVVDTPPINFFGQRPLALIMVTVFEVWRYFPLSFLFILARMQSIDTDMYEAADMDGASPFQKFWYLSLPMLLGILSVLFLLRFIWTFNKFDDIFLLTGGNAGTRTLTVNVYEQAFAVSNIGAGGAAVAVVIFACLIGFSVFFFKYMSREEGL